MHIHKRFTHRFTFGLLAFLMLFVGVALAGPPLICHTFDIGSAKSLPWASQGWNLTGKETYDTSKLAADTFKILTSDSTVLVHMETLRRATLYARTNPAAARELFNTLSAATKSVPSGAPPALYYFDIGYLAESYKQWLEQDSNPARGIDGYALVKQALQLRGDDAQMEFAAALITLNGLAGEHQDYVQRTLAGAKTDALLARNLFTHFMGPQSESMADMISRTSAAKVAKQ